MQAADTARYLLGKLYAAEGQYEAAEGVWAALIGERPKARVAADARVELADARYALGMKAFTDRDYEKAADWLGRLLPDVDLVNVRLSSDALLPQSDPMAMSKRRYIVFALAESLEKSDQWEAAAEFYTKLAEAGNPGEEFALSRLIRCNRMCGRGSDAATACKRLLDRFPETPYADACAQ